MKLSKNTLKSTIKIAGKAIGIAFLLYLLFCFVSVVILIFGSGWS